DGRSPPWPRNADSRIRAISRKSSAGSWAKPPAATAVCTATRRATGSGSFLPGSDTFLLDRNRGEVEDTPINKEEPVTCRLSTIVVAVLLMTGTAPTTSAQGLTGQISGIVVDSGGGVLPGVTVTVKNAGTATARDTVTASDGAFLFPDLLAGTNDLKAELRGLRTSEPQGHRRA